MLQIKTIPCVTTYKGYSKKVLAQSWSIKATYNDHSCCPSSFVIDLTGGLAIYRPAGGHPHWGAICSLGAIKGLLGAIHRSYLQLGTLN